MQLLNVLQDALFLVDRQGNIQVANQVAEHFFDYAQGELLGKPIEILIPARFRQQHVRQREAFSAHPHSRGMGSTRGLVAMRRDGTEFPVDISLSPFETATGFYVCAIVRDMTRFYQQEEALRTSQERFALAVRGSNDGIWDWNVLTGEVFYSDRFKELIGYEDQQFPNIFASFESHLHPEDHPKIMTALHEHLQGRTPYDVEYRLRTRGGEWRWFRARGQVIWDASGRATRMAGSITDVTDQKRLQQRFELAVQASPVALLMMDASGRIVLANRAAAMLFDYPQDALIGQPIETLVPDEFRERHVALRESFFSAPNARMMGANRRLLAPRRDGSQFAVEVGLSPVETDEGLFVLCGVSDITERIRAIAAIEEARQAAESANRSKSDFLANMSYEIRTPLNAIIGMTELVLQSELKPSQQEYLTTVLESGESLLSIINEILDFARIEAGKIDLVEAPFDVREIFGDILKSLAFRAHCKGIELACRIADDVPEFLQGDPVRLRQILVNLVGNAIKFTEEGEILVHVDGQSSCDAEIVLHVAVSDTGIGIPAEKLASIFEAFEQADTSMTRHFGGTGLGLAIACTLVEIMRGRIWVESTLGHGSTFHFTVTLQAASPADTKQSRADVGVLRGTRVMVVDDNATNRQILELILTEWDMKPQCVGGGEEALTLLRQLCNTGQRLPLVLTDINMPKMDGFTMVEQIRQDPSLAEARVIALTSGIRADDAQRCEQLGISVHLMKPVKQAELLNAVLRVVAGTGTSNAGVTHAAEASPAPARSLRILLVEDGLANRKLAQGLLERRGHEVTIAEDGQQALDCLEDHGFDLILMDVQMPVMDGLDATRAMRERERLSGQTDPGQRSLRSDWIGRGREGRVQFVEASLDFGSSGMLTFVPTRMDFADQKEHGWQSRGTDELRSVKRVAKPARLLSVPRHCHPC
jgi:two-component system, sensor histidine kinase and response regulator